VERFYSPVINGEFGELKEKPGKGIHWHHASAHKAHDKNHRRKHSSGLPLGSDKGVKNRDKASYQYIQAHNYQENMCLEIQTAGALIFKVV